MPSNIGKELLSWMRWVDAHPEIGPHMAKPKPPSEEQWMDCPACGNNDDERPGCPVCRGSGKIKK